MIRRIALILSMIAVCLASRAQTDVQLSQYYEMPSVFNPAATGRTDYLSIHGGARLQWVGIDGAPKTFLGTADMPVKLFDKRLAVGAVLQQESIGLYKSLNAGLQAGFKFKRWGGEFTGALQLGLYDQRFEGTKVFIPDGDDYHQGSDDAIPTTDLHGTAFDLGAGIWYTHKYWEAGISATHLTAPTIKMGGENGASVSDSQIYEFKAARTLYFMALGNIPVKNTLFELIPSLLVKSDLTNTSAEITARARYNKFISFGVGYRWDDAVMATVAAEIKNFYIGYSYDYALSAIHSASSGSHEIVVGYRLKLDLGDKNHHRHKSIRIM